MQPLPKIYHNLHTYPSAKDLAKDMPKHINIIGIGTGRLVIQDPMQSDSVIKIAAGHGITQNKNEIKIWETAKNKNISNLLLPIYEYDENKKYIKMPKVSTSFGLSKYNGPNAKEIYNQLKEHGIELHEIETVLYNGNPVAFDYGELKIIRNNREI